MLNTIERFLSVLSPVSLPRLSEMKEYYIKEAERQAEEREWGDGILWVAYDVRRTGIERMQQEGGE